jgi:uncharacterized protein YbaR (Trm112 family)
VDEEWVKLLACPWCVGRSDPPPAGRALGELELQGPPDKPEALRCRQCGRTYRVEDGIPNLLVEDATGPAAPSGSAG